MDIIELEETEICKCDSVDSFATQEKLKKIHSVLIPYSMYEGSGLNIHVSFHQLVEGGFCFCSVNKEIAEVLDMEFF